MPPAVGKRKRSDAQKLALSRARENVLKKPADLSFEATASHDTVDSVIDHLELTQDEFHATKEALQAAELEQQMQQLVLEDTQSQLQAEHSKNEQLYKALCTTRRTLQRANASKLKLQDKIRLLQNVKVPEAEKHAAVALKCLALAQQEQAQMEESLSDVIDNLMEELATVKDNLMEELATVKDNLMEELATVKDKLETSQKKIHALDMQQRRAPDILARKVEQAVNKVRAEKAELHLLDKGVYTPTAKALARKLTTAGCSKEFVGAVIEAVCKAAGVTVDAVISRRTVGRAILEGGIAAELQIGHEIAQATSLTTGNDGTTNKHIVVEARYVHVGHTDHLGNHQHKSLLLGVDPAVDHKATTQLEGWIKKIQDIAYLYSSSPFAHRQNLSLQLNDFLKKWKGMHTDHSKDQKKLVRIVQEMRAQVFYDTLGFEKLTKMTQPEIVELDRIQELKLILQHGGSVKWKALPSEEQMAKREKLRHEHIIQLGIEAYEDLPEDEQDDLMQFIWVGCAMHKDMNAMKGGNKAMMAWWEETGNTPPIILANRDNAAVLDDAPEDESEFIEVERHAFDNSTCGGVKTTSIAGALFNDKDTKKGQQYTVRWYFEKFCGKVVSFPDTSNNRYQSHGRAAGELLLYHKEYIRFLELLRDSKGHFNHMEQNLYNALHDIPTLHELVVLALYSQSVTHPYMRKVRGPGAENINMLDLGPFHENLKEYLQKIIDSPSLVASPNATCEQGTFDGLEWNNPDIVAAIQAMMQEFSLIHLEPLLATFFKGSAETWERFTSEFAPGGAIDLATDEQKARAWMPPTNDHDEGALGGYRLYDRKKPTTSTKMYNAQAMLQQNKTEQFMEENLIPVDYGWLCGEARSRDEQGLARKERQEHVEHLERVAEEAAKEAAEKAAVKQREAERLASINIVYDHTKVDAMTVRQLTDQIERWRSLSLIKDIPLKSKLGVKAEKVAELKRILGEYQRIKGTSHT